VGAHPVTGGVDHRDDFPDVQRGEPDVGGILGAAGLGLVLVGLAIVFAINPQTHDGFRGTDHVSAA